MFQSDEATSDFWETQLNPKPPNFFDPCTTDIYRHRNSLWNTDFEISASAFVKETSREKRKGYERIQVVEQKLQRKHEVLSELMEESQFNISCFKCGLVVEKRLSLKETVKLRA